MPRELLQLMEDWSGYHSVRGRPVNERALSEALKLINNTAGWSRRAWAARLEEAVTTSDFPYLFGVITDRQVLAHYRAFVADWQAYFRMKTVKDFNTVRRHKILGNDERLPEVAEKGEYLVSEVAEGRYEYAVKKYGRQFDISWEAVINDDLDAFGDVAPRMGTAAVRTEAYNATGTFCSATGPHTGLFGMPITDPADGGLVTNLGVLPLTILNLETTLQLMAAQVDANGEPISVRGVHLVVPPALEFTARQILTSAVKQWTEGAVGVPVPYPTTNVIAQVGMKLHVDPYLPIIDVSGNANTTWYVFADPSQGAAMEFGRLRGHEEPEIWMKASDAVTLTGAPISPFEGDFVSDNIFYRVRHCKGTCRLDPRFAYSQAYGRQ